MNGEERRSAIIEILNKSTTAISGDKLAELLDVSRQITVQDIALLRARDFNIISTNRGYLLQKKSGIQRVFKVYHTDEDMITELNSIVDLGGFIKDEFVYHKIHGIIKADLRIKSRWDVKTYMEEIKNSKSSPLKNITSGYHYHTISAENMKILDNIEDELRKLGFLAELRDYEPVDFNQKERD
jgi:transcriptional regulator of NAD metabolism